MTTITPTETYLFHQIFSSLTFAFSTELIYESLLVFCSGLLASGSGLGGGAFFVPLYVLIQGLDPKIAIPLSKFTIMGVGIGGYLANYSRRHPNQKLNRPLIDYDVALALEPMTLVGSILGVMLNIWLPTIAIIFSLIILLIIASYRTFSKARRLQLAEYAAQELERAHVSDHEDETEIEIKEQESKGLLQADTNYKIIKGNQVFEKIDSDEEEFEEEFFEHPEKFVETKETENPTIPLDLHEELRVINQAKVNVSVTTLLKFVLLLGILLLLTFLKGGEGRPSIVGIECGSSLYWILVFSAIPIFGLISYLVVNSLVQEYHLKEMLGYKFQDGEMKWTGRSAFLYPSLSVVAGWAAGMLGIGGGMVKVPIMLEMGIVPSSASATSAFMIIFTSTSVSMQYLVFGKIPIGYGLWFASIGLLSAVAGHKIVAYFIKKYRSQSYVTYFLAIVISVSALVLVFFSCSLFSFQQRLPLW